MSLLTCVRFTHSHWCYRKLWTISIIHLEFICQTFWKILILQSQCLKFIKGCHGATDFIVSCFSESQITAGAPSTLAIKNGTKCRALPQGAQFVEQNTPGDIKGSLGNTTYPSKRHGCCGNIFATVSKKYYKNGDVNDIDIPRILNFQIPWTWDLPVKKSIKFIITYECTKFGKDPLSGHRCYRVITWASFTNS